MNYQSIIEQIHTDITPLFGQGKVATYIPALASAGPYDFAMSLQLVNGESYHIGLSDKTFSIQSISKVFMYEMALSLFEESLVGRVNVEPSDNPLNSLIQFEYEKGIPRNPFINPGDIVIADMLTSHFGNNAYENILQYFQKSSNNLILGIDSNIASSELESGFRNYALANLMKSFGNIKNPIESVLYTYFNACSIRANTIGHSHSVLHLANKGIDPITMCRTQQAY